MSGLGAQPPNLVRKRSWRLVLQAIREFAFVPLMVVLAFMVLAAVTILADQTQVWGLSALGDVFGQVIGNEASSTALQSIATGMLTVTSITFSVLLLAVQQTASNLTPVVFDQFVRRTMNQVLLGFFVGLSLYSFVVMAAVQDKKPPLVGAGVATVMTVVAMLLLLVLVYTTVDQMRPSNVLTQIHDRTVKARERQRTVRLRTLRQEQSESPVTATYRCASMGYVTNIDLDALEAALEQVPKGEIRLHVTLGQAVSYGDILATVSDDDESDANELMDHVRDAIRLERRRDIDLDATTGIREIANIGWTSGSTAKQSPQVARQAIDVLKDLAARWLEDDYRQLKELEKKPVEPLRIVYRDDDVELVLDALYSLMVSGQESHQHLTAVRVLRAYSELLEHARGVVHERLMRDLEQMRPLLDGLPSSPMLDEARTQLEQRLG